MVSERRQIPKSTDHMLPVRNSGLGKTNVGCRSQVSGCIREELTGKRNKGNFWDDGSVLCLVMHP